MAGAMAPAVDEAADATRDLLPWNALVAEIGAVLVDATVRVPERIVLPTAQGAVLFVMPACDSRVAMTKLITLTPANAGIGRPAIQGDVAVFDVATGERRLLLDGPTVTARRTAAVSAYAARLLAPQTAGPMLIVGAGVQGQAHLEAFAAVLGVRQFRIASRRHASAERLAAHARALGCDARVAADADAALADCPLVATCTPARALVLHAQPRADAFVAAVGAFAPDMAEVAPQVCQALAARGRIVLDTPEAAAEAGDLLQAGLDVAALPTLAHIVRNGAGPARGPMLFKNCGWAGWDLAAARLAARAAMG